MVDRESFERVRRFVRAEPDDPDWLRTVVAVEAATDADGEINWDNAIWTGTSLLAVEYGLEPEFVRSLYPTTATFDVPWVGWSRVAG